MQPPDDPTFIPPPSAEEIESLRDQIGRRSPIVDVFAPSFFGPAIEAGVMTRAQADVLTAGPFLILLYHVMRVRPTDGPDTGRMIVGRGKGFLRDGTCEGARLKHFFDSAISIDVQIDGRRETLDRNGIYHWAQRVEAVHWPEDTLAAFLGTHEMRAWYFDLRAALPTLPQPASLNIGPAPVAKRRVALWKDLGPEDRRSTTDVVNLEELHEGGHSILQGLIVPGGRIWVPPFEVPSDPDAPETPRRVMADKLRRYDRYLGVDSLPINTEPVPLEWLGLRPEDEDKPAKPVPKALVTPPLDARPAEPESAPAVLATLARGLPRRESKLVQLLGKGFSYSQAAKILKLLPSTVRAMATRIRLKAKSARKSS